MKKKPTKVAKEKVVNVRCTEQQQAMLTAVAAREGLGLSTWLLHVGILAAQERQAKEERR